MFRDELAALLPRDAHAKRLAGQAWALTEWLAKKASGFAPPLSGQVLLHGHCHDKSVLGFAGEAALLRRCGADVEVVGCRNLRHLGSALQIAVGAARVRATGGQVFVRPEAG